LIRPARRADQHRQGRRSSAMRKPTVTRSLLFRDGRLYLRALASDSS
jgi:hypothetical protein